MPAACIEPMESCNEGDESGITLTCGQFTNVITKNPNNKIVKLKSALLTTVNTIAAITKI